MKNSIKNHTAKISSIARRIDRDVRIMEVCGGHTRTVMKYGLRDILPENIRLISGPGCPVCVSSQEDIDAVISLAEQEIPIATYGDMMRVPGSKSSLEEIKARLGNVFEVYSATEVLSLREKYPDIVFFGVGFETTAPMTAYLLKNGICVYSVHKLIPPALKILSTGDIDGFINPGHVSTIIGTHAYENIKIPQAVAGFTAERLLLAISALLELIKDGKKTIVNAYPEAVTEEGNSTAQELLSEFFKINDSKWRGLGMLPCSGLEVKDDRLNAKVRYKDIIRIPNPKKTACRCGEILKGLIEPKDCKLYGEKCTPENPVGACMVSEEGSCSIYYRYGK